MLQIFNLQFWYEHFRDTPLRFILLHIRKQIFFFSTFSESEISIVVQEMTALCSHLEVPREVFTQKLILYYFLIKLFHEELPNVVFQILLLSSYFGFCDIHIWLGFFEFNSSGKKKFIFFQFFSDICQFSFHVLLLVLLQNMRICLCYDLCLSKAWAIFWICFIEL